MAGEQQPKFLQIADYYKLHLATVGWIVSNH